MKLNRLYFRLSQIVSVCISLYELGAPLVVILSNFRTMLFDESEIITQQVYLERLME